MPFLNHTPMVLFCVCKKWTAFRLHELTKCLILEKQRYLLHCTVHVLFMNPSVYQAKHLACFPTPVVNAVDTACSMLINVACWEEQCVWLLRILPDGSTVLQHAIQWTGNDDNAWCLLPSYIYNLIQDGKTVFWALLPKDKIVLYKCSMGSSFVEKSQSY